LAGLRVGCAIGHKDLIEALIRIKDSFNSYPIDRFAEAGAIAAMQDHDYFAEACQKVIATRAQLVKDLQALDFEILPSGANFIFAMHKTRDGEDLAAKLRAHNIVIRHFKKPVRIAPYIRITIGTNQQSAALINCLKTLLKSA
jgi:histidinol-phosphate aminotransferase